MPASAIYLMDLKGKILLSRNYRGDIPMSTSDKFTKHMSAATATLQSTSAVPTPTLTPPTLLTLRTPLYSPTV